MNYITAFLEKLTCKHKWDVFSKWLRIYPEAWAREDQEFDKHKIIIVCKKCGKLDQIITYPNYKKEIGTKIKK